MARILGIGDNTIDTYVSAGLQFPGGNAVNVAVLSRRLGADTSYLGCLGEDEGGAILEAALREEGVDLSHVRRLPGSNARARIAHDRGDRRFHAQNAIADRHAAKSDLRQRVDLPLNEAAFGTDRQRDRSRKCARALFVRVRMRDERRRPANQR